METEQTARLAGLSFAFMHNHLYGLQKKTKYSVRSGARAILDFFCLSDSSWSHYLSLLAVEYPAFNNSDLVQTLKLTTPWSLRAVWTAPTDLWLPKLSPLVLRSFKFKPSEPSCPSVFRVFMNALTSELTLSECKITVIRFSLEMTSLKKSNLIALQYCIYICTLI